MTNSGQDSESLGSKCVGVKESRWSKKDYVTIIFSTLSFFVSAVTVFFNILLTEENISVHAGNAALLHLRDQASLSVSPNADTTIVFINSGNTSIAVMRVHLVYIQLHDENSNDCRWQDKRTVYSSADPIGMILLTDFEPMVLKPKEVGVRHVKFVSSWAYDVKRSDDNELLFPLNEHNKKATKMPINVCVEVSLISPSETIYKTVPAFKYWAEAGGINYDPRQISNEPQTLTKKYSIFGLMALARMIN